MSTNFEDNFKCRHQQYLFYISAIEPTHVLRSDVSSEPGHSEESLGLFVIQVGKTSSPGANQKHQCDFVRGAAMAWGSRRFADARISAVPLPFHPRSLHVLVLVFLRPLLTTFARTSSILIVNGLARCFSRCLLRVSCSRPFSCARSVSTPPTRIWCLVTSPCTHGVRLPLFPRQRRLPLALTSHNTSRPMPARKSMRCT